METIPENKWKCGSSHIDNFMAGKCIVHGGYRMPIHEVPAIFSHDKLDSTERYVYIDRRSLKTEYQKYA